MAADTYETKITQWDDEINPLIEIFQRENVRSFLEIGSRFGGSLWRIATNLPVGARIVSVDSGMGMGGRKPGATESLKRCVSKLKEIGYDAHLIVGDSQLEPIISKVQALGPFDACFIDGDHELRGVTRDWLNYGAISRVVSFHDVAWTVPPNHAPGQKMVEVKQLWDKLKLQFRSETFVHEGGNMGIGVLWHDAAV